MEEKEKGKDKATNTVGAGGGGGGGVIGEEQPSLKNSSQLRQGRKSMGFY